MDALSSISGVVAIVLGGSRARGVERANSDADIGILYQEETPLDVGQIRIAARDLSDDADVIVTELYGWGPWVNGGAWLTVQGKRIDLLYRNIDQIERVLVDSKEGRFVHDFRQQPPFGFLSYMYLAELDICRPLRDANAIVETLKRQVRPYPAALRRSLVQDSLWSAEFTLSVAKPWAQAGDRYTTLGSLTRAAFYLTQAIFALNEQYFISDKTALGEISTFTIAPTNYGDRVAAAVGGDPGLADAHTELASVLGETAALAGELYRMPYRSVKRGTV